ncbi:MAG: two-component sensor histidine kinase [Desulfomonile tiedjei]|nr:two-component sensor histidine kinase [Desulfomonile tiedjei]
MPEPVHPGPMSRLRPYSASVLIALFAVLLAPTAGVVYAAGAAALAAMSAITVRKLLDQVEVAAREARIADEQLSTARVFSSVDELSAGIAHEINNPLGIIAQEAQWIQHLFRGPAFHGLRETEECADSLTEICRQVDRCKEIVQKLLGLARQMEPVVQGVDIRNLVRDMTVLVEREATARNIKVVTTWAKDLPVIYSDPQLLRQVLLNLLLNATQAIEKDGVISVTTSPGKDDGLEIVVEDTGCGIPKESLGKIFTPFFSTKPEGKGTGLGLALCRGIVETLGGSISVTSELGKCTTFRVHLPLRRPLRKER